MAGILKGILDVGQGLANVATLGLIPELNASRDSGVGQIAALMAAKDEKFREQEKRNQENIDRILAKSAKDQKALLAEHHKQAEKAQKAQKAEYEKMDKERKENAKRELERVTNVMDGKHKEQQREMKQKLDALSDAQKEERTKLLAEQEEQKKAFNATMDGLKAHMAEQEQMHAAKLEELMKQVEKKSYEASYPIPEALQNHLAKNPRSFNIQVLGCRGAGKSTFVTKMLKEADIITKAKRGVNECTIETEFFDITNNISNKPDRYDKVFLCDQPGIGGLKITEAGYLANFGPGHFNFTIMLGEKGFNEMDMSLLKHLLFNKKPLVFVRSQCDSSISGIKDDHEEEHNEEITDDQAMVKLRKEFSAYIEKEVISQLENDLNMDIFYIGLPPRKYPDFKRLVNFVLSGAMLKKVANVEAIDLDMKSKTA